MTGRFRITPDGHLHTDSAEDAIAILRLMKGGASREDAVAVVGDSTAGADEGAHIGLSRVVRKSIGKKPGGFTGDQLAERIGTKFAGRFSETQVKGVLRRLAEAGELKVIGHKKGKGRPRPIYQATKTFDPEGGR